MRVILFLNGWVGWKVAEWLQQQKVDIVGIVLHPQERQRYGEEILRDLPLHASKVFDGSKLEDPATLKAIAALKPDLGVSVFFGYILRKDCLDVFPQGIINVHPAYLPYNRGAYPNVWSIVEGTPAGVTIHYIDEQVDTGDIIAQQEIPVHPTDTGKSLYERLEPACFSFFCQTWPLIASGKAPRQKQSGAGSVHKVKDVEKIDEINLDRKYSAKELIDLLRARTFAPHPGAYIREGKRKIYLRLELLSEEQVARESALQDRRQADIVRERLSEGELRLRPAVMEDGTLLWKWANDPTTREGSFTQEPIPWENHLRWLSEKLRDPDSIMFVATDAQSEPVGQIRFDQKSDETIVSVSIDGRQRGKGYGAQLLKLACKELFAATPITAIHAYVKPSNEASIRAFAKAGFQKIETVNIHGTDAEHFTLSRDTLLP